jgi:hypothetical protein
VSWAKTGDFYELKPISVGDGFFRTFAEMKSDLAFYAAQLRAGIPAIPFALGTTWLPGVTEWPTFTSKWAPPGWVLVTATAYGMMPGAIWYDFLGPDDAVEILAATKLGEWGINQVVNGIIQRLEQSLTQNLSFATARSRASQAIAVGPNAEIAADAAEDISLEEEEDG